MCVYVCVCTKPILEIYRGKVWVPMCEREVMRMNVCVCTRGNGRWWCRVRIIRRCTLFCRQ